MAKTQKKNTQKKSKEKEKQVNIQEERHSNLFDEIWGLVIVALGIFLIFALLTEHCGALGEKISYVLAGLFGGTAIALPFFFLLAGLLLLIHKVAHLNIKSFIISLILFINIDLVFSINYLNGALEFNVKEFFISGTESESGGVCGMSLGYGLMKLVGDVGIWVVAIVVIIICIMLLLNTPLSRFLHISSKPIKDKVEEIKNRPEKEVTSDINISNTDNGIEVTRDYTKRRKPLMTVSFTEEKPKNKKKSNVKYNMAYEDEITGNGEKTKTKAGFGLDGSPAKSQKGFGLDGGTTVKAGYGLDDSNDKKSTKAKTSSNPVKTTGATISSYEDKGPTKAELKNAKLDQSEINMTKAGTLYKLPPINLLNTPSRQKSDDRSVLEQRVYDLEETLRNFNVDAKVVQVTQGPTVTRFEVQPAMGVRVNTIVNLSDDIALNLRAKSIRMEAPIPGKNAIGIEIENENINSVGLREIIESKEFKNMDSNIGIALGKDIGGKAIVSDLAKMPHLLVAGATGSGKSVCINTIITSILYRATPDQVKLILIDPKVVELGNYNGIPHLLIPVVTDTTKAAAALNWAVAEMTERYRKFEKLKVRNLESYNHKVRLMAKKEDNEFEELPQIVIVIDELADLMMTAKKQVEEAIVRLTQLARAAGMHLIVATQRPSTDVVTGLIKSNIPARIAFRMASYHDSMTVIDTKGAESLVGNGDMLFCPTNSTIRIQGAFLTDKELKDVLEFVKAQVPDPKYDEEVITTIEKPASLVEEGSGDEDELMEEAILHVIRAKQASVSMLQRRFRIGYNRAARMIDAMEEQGIIGPSEGAKPRTVLMTEEEYYQ
ncbi:MAG: DNA translocase FtsK [Clostridia bacterium]|nr:DNA translocase FtsK [Clostridia bacterium]